MDLTPLDYLKEMRMPALSIAFMAFSAAAAILAPIALFIYYKKKYKVKIKPALIGAGTFVLFALLLEAIFISMLSLDSLISIYPTPALNQAIYITIVCLCSGLFEETGRFVVFKWILKKEREDSGTPLSYGVGHGGIEAILLVGFSMVSLIATSIMVNNGQLVTVLANATDDQVLGVIDLIQTDSTAFLASGFERLFAIVLHISLSVMVWMAVKNKKLWLYPLAILLHSGTNVSAALYQRGIIENLWVVEGIIAACVIVIAVLTRLIYVKMEKSLESVRIYSEETERHEEAEETTEK